MEIETALYNRLISFAGLTDLIGKDSDGDYKLYPDEAPDIATLNYVIYKTVSDVKDHTLDGQVEIEEPIFQFTIHATDKPTVKLIGRQLRAALQDFSGTLNGLEIQNIEMMNELPSHYTSEDGTLEHDLLDQEYQVTYVYQ